MPIFANIFPLAASIAFLIITADVYGAVGKHHHLSKKQTKKKQSKQTNEKHIILEHGHVCARDNREVKKKSISVSSIKHNCMNFLFLIAGAIYWIMGLLLLMMIMINLTSTIFS